LEPFAKTAPQLPIYLPIAGSRDALFHSAGRPQVILWATFHRQQTETTHPMFSLNYLSGYPQALQDSVRHMLEQNMLKTHLLQKYPRIHQVSNDKALRAYTTEIKNQFLKKSAPVGKVVYDEKIHIIHNALGLHSSVQRVQGNKIKSKNEIRIGGIFKKTPEPFLRMIVVHELAHLKEREHNKAFYKLCQHMLPNYHQLEFDLRIYLTYLELHGEIYKPSEQR